MKIYCQKCGHPSEYTTYKPKFCSACGMPVDPTAKASVEESVEEPVEEVQSHIEADDPPEHIPFLHKLDVFIDTSDVQPNTVKFGDIAGSKQKGDIDEEEYSRGVGREQIDSATFKQQFQKEAGSLRSNNAKKEKG